MENISLPQQLPQAAKQHLHHQVLEGSAVNSISHQLDLFLRDITTKEQNDEAYMHVL